MIFIDASALVAIIAREPEAGRFLKILDGDVAKATSAVAVYEAVLALARLGAPLENAREDVSNLLTQGGVHVAPIGAAEQEAALDAFARFGKRRHPARLNMGDCFAYACAKTHDAALLYKGDDFSRTDIRSA